MQMLVKSVDIVQMFVKSVDIVQISTNRADALISTNRNDFCNQ